MRLLFQRYCCDNNDVGIGPMRSWRWGSGSRQHIRGEARSVAERRYNGRRNGGIPAEAVELTREGLLARVDRGARNRLGLSGWEEFADLYYADELPDTLAVNELGILLDSAQKSGV